MTLADRVVVMNQGVVQQVGTPVDIYDRPLNTFVAGFIGSPAMNLIEGRIDNGVFEAEGVTISGLSQTGSGNVTLGFRAEDATMADGAGEISADVYSMELLGEATMITVRIGGALVSVKSAKDYRADIGDRVNIHVPVNFCHVFDATTGQRIE